jgi:hypothetical protein
VEAVAIMDLAKFDASDKLGRAGQAPFAPKVMATTHRSWSPSARSSSKANERVVERAKKAA